MSITLKKPLKKAIENQDVVASNLNDCFSIVAYFLLSPEMNNIDQRSEKIAYSTLN